MNEVTSWIAVGSPWAALLGVIVAGLYAIQNGKLVPKLTVDLLVQQWEARLAESAERERDWKTAYQNEAERGDADSRTLDRLMIYAETADRVLQNLPSSRGDAP